MGTNKVNPNSISIKSFLKSSVDTFTHKINKHKNMTIKFFIAPFLDIVFLTIKYV